jgi:hypothetical protein
MRLWSIVEVVRGDRSGSVMGRTARRLWELIRSLASRGRVRVRLSSTEISNRQLTVKYLHVWKDTSQPKTGYDAAEQDHLPRYRYPVPDRRSVRCIRVVTLQGYWARTTALHTTTAVAAAIPTSLVVAADRHSNVGRPSHFVGGLIPEGTQEE